MPRGPRGEKRPADVIGTAVKVAKIATGELEEDQEKESAAVESKRKGGKEGGKARAAKMTKAERSEAARKAAQARWSKSSQ